MDYAQRRRNMVESQIRTNKVTDQAVIDALLHVPREVFVPDAYRGVAYVDEDLSIGDGRVLVEPMILARLLQTARIEPTDRVLEIGGASGYVSAILAQLAADITTVDDNRRLVEQARTTLTLLGVTNVLPVFGRMAEGAPAGAPFDVIVINGAVSEIPATISGQLAEGGRLVGVIQPLRGLGRAVLMERVAGIISSRDVFDAATPLLPGFAPIESFVF